MSSEFKSIDDAVEKYVELRDFLKIESKKFNDLEEEVKGQLAQISMWLRDKGDALGVDSFKTSSGTAFRTVKTSYRVQDWNEFIGWIKETGNFQCLEHRVAKLATKEIHDDLGEVPPGIYFSAEVEFSIRRPIKQTD